EATTTWAGPMCGCVLADFGADVVKVEMPGGEMARRAPPMLPGTNPPISFMHATVNRNKRSLTLDLRRPEGRDVFLRLAARADVVIENFRPGVMDGLGLGQAALREANPGLVYCSISGFGHTGPWRERRAFAGIVHATTGVLHRQAVATERDPIDSALAIGDTVSGLQAVVAVLAALRLRERTGRGQFIDMAMHDALLSVQEAANFHLFSDESSENDFLCSWVYRCGDDFVAMPDDPRAHWDRLTRVMEKPELATDRRYDDYSKRAARLDELEALVQGWVAGQRSADAVVERLQTHGLPGARIMSLAEALECEQTRARGMTRERPDRSGGTVPVLDSPYRFSEATAGVRGEPAFRGEDNRDVLSALLGLDDAELDQLERDGVLSSRIRRDP
ncbi:MAG: CoA transferase, partial [Myxococcales bacterium]